MSGWQVDRVAVLPGWPSGVAVTGSGRVFVSAPQHDQPAHMPTVVEIVDGTVQPLDPATTQGLTSAQGLRAGPDETLYAPDSGVRALTGIDSERAGLWAIDVATATVTRRYTFPTGVALPTTYLNDLTVDQARGVAYLVDAGGQEPHGLIRLDLTTGASRRMLHDHPSVRAAASPRPGGILVAGAPLSPDDPAQVGATGITFGGDHELFWNRADELFSIDLEVLDSDDPHDIDAAIVSWPPRPFASDGLDRDAFGRVLLTDLANSGVQRLNPATGRYELLTTDPAISWPDGVCAAPGGTVYVTSSQIHRSTMFSAPDTRQPPFGVYRLRPDQGNGQHQKPNGLRSTWTLLDVISTVPWPNLIREVRRSEPSRLIGCPGRPAREGVR